MVDQNTGAPEDSPEDSSESRFEQAVDAVITGDLEMLTGLLAADPSLVHARSRRITDQDPAVHGATLLHYLAANGVENERQRSPQNAVEIATLLLESGADPNALAAMYGGQCTTLSMLVSSTPPADAGVQVPLVHVLLDYGADPNGAGDGSWVNPIMTALVFGYLDAAQALVDRGARVDSLEQAAGLGRDADIVAWLPTASPEARHRALAVAAINGQVRAAQLLLDAGEDPNRFNPDGFHAHSTPLHQAALAGHLALVQLLVSRGARTDIRDPMWDGTPLDWAEHAGKREVMEYLNS